MNKKGIIISGIVGSALEFYDFALYAALAGVLSKIFFAHSETAVLQSLMTVAVGFIARPFGAYIFGQLGDKLGRKKTLGIAIIMMGIPTSLIGLLPSYDSVGSFATFLLVFCRILQGMSVGGELTGSTVFIMEHFGQKRVNLAVATVGFGAVLGFVLANFSVYLCSSFGNINENWRFLFITGIFVSLFGNYIRRKLDESPEFETVIKEKKSLDSPFKYILQHHRSSLIKGSWIGIFASVQFNILSVYTGSYVMTTTGQSMPNVAIINISCMILTCCTNLIAAYLSDKYGAKKIGLLGLVGVLFYAIPYFYLLSLGDHAINIIASCIFGGLTSFSFSGMYIRVNTLFPANCRYVGASVSYAIGYSIGSNYPAIAHYLMTSFGEKYIPGLMYILIIIPTIYMVLCEKSNTDEKYMKEAA